ncbi:EI24 domain-containing protein [Auraticoccus monumenti]|uniref:CysZ protein n=1 Tax=Auraticoccus monumenti TaxID=675864 RepID=A0A1G6YW94_9ACTN|nr:EI24 domain-containing protein [Auraticoccus monumenti]SDD94343.1 CysZ protein [Auraticoccus monumenti]
MALIPDALSGVALLPRALRLLARRPRLLGLGLLPPLITTVVLGALLVLLLMNQEALVGLVTGFADDWSPGAAQALRWVVAAALVVGAVAVWILTFSALTLAIGSPLYDRIAEQTEELAGSPPEPVEEPLRVSVTRSVRQSLGLVALSLLLAVPLFLLTLIPVAGTVLGPVASACVGGWMVTTELVSGALERRGRTSLRERWALMRGQRARVLGFGVPVFLLLALPLVAIFVFPVAAAGGTLLARELVGEGQRRDTVDAR